MELLERDCQQFVRMAPADRPAHAVLSFTSLINQLNNLADESPSASSASILLERAELWCEQLDRVMASSPSPTGEQQANSSTSSSSAATSRLTVLLAKDRTFTALRDVAAKEQQWQVALKYAKSANALDEEIADVVSTQEGSSKYSASDRLEMKRLQQTFGAIRIAKNQMNMCVLLSKIQRHNEASTYAASAVALLRAIAARHSSRQFSAASPTALEDGPQSLGSSPARHGSDAEAAAHDDHPQALLAGALFNYGAQLEHIAGRGREAQAAYNEALDLALVYLGKKHPLTQRLVAILKRSTEAAVGTMSLPTVAPRGANVFFVAKPPPAATAQGSKNQRASSQQGPRRHPATQGGLDSGSARRPPTAPSVDKDSQQPARKMSALQPLDGGTLAEGGSLPPVGISRSHSSPIKPTAVGRGATVTAVAWDEDELPVVRPKNKKEHAALQIDLVAALQQHQHHQPAESVTGSPTRTHRSDLAGLQPAASSRSLKSNPPPSSPTRQTSARRASLKQREENATQQIQQRLAHWTEEVTGRLFKEFTRRYDAALRIQRAWKCSQCRLEAYNRRQIFYHHLHVQQVSAVHAITSSLRTHLATKHRMKTLEGKKKEQQERVELERRRNRSATIINRNVRLYLVRKHKTQALMRLLQLQQEEKLKQYDVAAVLVQRWWRVIRVQKAYWRRRQAEYAEDVRRKAESERLGRAATSIQRIVRGLLGRRYFALYKVRRLQEIKEYKRKVKESTVLVRTFLRELHFRLSRVKKEADLELSRRSSAAIAEQVSWEDALRRRAVAEAKVQSLRVTKAALTIQKFFRRVRSRRELKYRRTVQRATNSLRIDKEFRERRAAIRLQCFARIIFARHAVNRVKASVGRRLLLATRLVQRVGRGYFAGRAIISPVYMLAQKMTRDALECAARRKEHLVTVIQAFMRSSLSLQAAIRLRDAISAEETLVYNRFLQERREDEAATKIQSIARMRQDKRRAEEIRAELLRQQQAALKVICCIQRFARKVLAKIALEARRKERARKIAQLHAAAQLQHELFVMRAMEFDTLCEIEFMQIVSDEEQTRSTIRQSFFVSAHLGHPEAGTSGNPLRNDDDDDDVPGPGTYDAE